MAVEVPTAEVARKLTSQVQYQAEAALVERILIAVQAWAEQMAEFS